MTLDHRIVGAHAQTIGVNKGRLSCRNVLWNIHQHGSWTTSTCNVKCFFKSDGKVINVLDQEIVFDDGSRDAHGIGLLEGILTNRVGWHVTGNDDHRNGIGICGRNSSNSVRYSRAGSDQCHTHLTSGSRVAIGCMNRGLFVTNQNMFKLILFEDLVVDKENRTAGITPYVFNALSMQRMHQHLGANHFRGRLFCGALVGVGLRTGCGLTTFGG